MRLREETIPPEWRRVHGQALQDLLRQEARAKAELRRIIRAAERLHGSQNAEAAIAIERGLTFTITRLRRQGREAGAKALGRELALARARGIFVDPGPQQFTTGIDLARAQVISRKFASDWYVKASDNRETATERMSGRIDTIGITETAESFSAESKAQLATATQRTDGTMVLFEFWDAALDRRTCAVCERASGTVVLLGMSFSAGRPGGVHPRCRCNSTVIPMPIWFTREIDRDDILDYPEAFEAA